MSASPPDLPEVPDGPESDEAQLRLVRASTATCPPPGTLAEELQPWSGDRSFVMAFARGLSVLHAFREQRRPLTIAQVSHRTHLHRAAVRRLLHTLEVLGYVRQDGMLYHLAPRALTLAHGYLSSTQLVHIARPLVVRLSQALQGFCMLVVPDGDVSTVACTTNFPMTRTPDEQPSNLGHCEPLHATAAGLVLLAGRDDAAVQAYCDRQVRRPPVRGTPAVPGDLVQRVRQVREQGHAVLDLLLPLVLRSVAVPVPGEDGRPVAALVARTEAERHGAAESAAERLPLLRSTAREMCGQLLAAAMPPR
jgi:IclR family pca regulon transcriptional regulator